MDTDTGIQAVTLQAFFDDAISELARAKEWPPLHKVAALALVREGDPDDGDERLFYYRWPSDCEKARYLYDGNTRPSKVYPHAQFEVNADGTGKLIACDVDDAFLVYTMEMDDVDQMSVKWKRALEYYLASLIAPTLCGGDPTGLGPRAYANYERCLDQAWAEYLNERSRGNSPEAEEIEGR